MGEMGRNDRPQDPRISSRSSRSTVQSRALGLRHFFSASLIWHRFLAVHVAKRLPCPVAGSLHQRPDLIRGVSRAKDHAGRRNLCRNPSNRRTSRGLFVGFLNTVHSAEQASSTWSSGQRSSPARPAAARPIFSRAARGGRS